MTSTRSFVRRAAVAVAVGALALGCAQTDRPTLTEERLDPTSGAELTVDADSPAPGATDDDVVTGDRVEIGGQETASSLPDGARLTPAWLPAGWQPGASDVDRLITACNSLETMSPARDGIAGPVTALHDTSGVTAVQAIFQMPDAATSVDKLTELKDALDRCDGSEVDAGRITVDPAPASLVDAAATLGEARLTARITLEADDGTTLSGDLVAVAVGHLVVGALAVGPTPSVDGAWAVLVAATSTSALTG